MFDADFRAMKGGVDLNGDCRFGQSSGLLPGGRHEHRQDAVRPTHGFPALDDVRPVRRALVRDRGEGFPGGVIENVVLEAVDDVLAGAIRQQHDPFGHFFDPLPFTHPKGGDHGLHLLALFLLRLLGVHVWHGQTELVHHEFTEHRRRQVRGNTTRAKVLYLLKGIVFGNDGRALSPWHTTKKNGRRYRYYVPQRDAKEHAGASGLPRLPAAELESAVLDQLRAILRAPNLLGDILPQAIKLDPTLDEAKITVAMTRLDAIWDQLFPAEQTRIVKLLVEKVIVSPNDLEVRLRANGIERLVLELRPEPVEQTEEAMA